MHAPPGMGARVLVLGLGLSGTVVRTDERIGLVWGSVSSTSSHPCEPHFPTCRMGIAEAPVSQGGSVRSKQGHSRPWARGSAPRLRVAWV